MHKNSGGKIRTTLHLKNARQLVGGDVDDAIVHELDDGLQVLEPDVLQDHNRVLEKEFIICGV